MRVDGGFHLDFQRVESQRATETHQEAMRAPSLASLAMEELASIRNEATSETMDELSIGLSAIFKKINLDNRGKHSMMSSLERLMESLDRLKVDSLFTIAEGFAKLPNVDAIMAKLNSSSFESGEMMLILASLIGMKHLSESKKKKLRDLLMAMLAEEGAELEIFAAAEGMTIDKNSMTALRDLYQHATRGESGLAHWFDLLKKQKNKQKYIRIMIKALSEPLSDKVKEHDMLETAATIQDLRRLLLFLTFQDHSNSVARAFGLAREAIMDVTLELLDQSWVYPESIGQLVAKLTLPEEREVVFLRRWKDLMSVMSDDCYRDQEQKEQILEAMFELMDMRKDD